MSQVKLVTAVATRNLVTQVDQRIVRSTNNNQEFSKTKLNLHERSKRMAFLG